MSQSSSRARRRAGHGESAIRYVTGETTGVFDAEQMDIMRDLCRRFEGASEPLDAERTTSRMHGRMWELRAQATTRRQPDWSFGLGAPFARQLARIGGPAAKGLLFSLGHQSPARLRELCFGLAFDLPVRMPPWAAALPHAMLSRAAATSWEEPEQLVMLEFTRTGHQTFTVAALIDDARGGIVGRYGLLGPVAEILELDDADTGSRGTGRRLTPTDPGEACRRVRTAIARADRAAARLVDLESAKELRALTLARIDAYLDAGAAEGQAGGVSDE